MPIDGNDEQFLALMGLGAKSGKKSHYPELKRRLSEMTLEDSFQVRVRSALIDLLPGGTASIDLVAQKLGLSRRSLQRFLSNEGTTFQKELDHTRFLLAKQYLRDPSLTLADMTYLLGYQDVSTFQRAFHKWTNMSLTQYKETHRQPTSSCSRPITRVY